MIDTNTKPDIDFLAALVKAIKEEAEKMQKEEYDAMLLVSPRWNTGRSGIHAQR